MPALPQAPPVSSTHPRDQSLVESSDTSSCPDIPESLPHGLTTVGSHLGLEDLERLTERCHLEL
jgi:hypothetical protein